MNGRVDFGIWYAIIGLSRDHLRNGPLFFWRRYEVKKIVAVAFVCVASLMFGQTESKGGAVAGDCGGAVVSDCGGAVANNCGGVAKSSCRGRVVRTRPTFVARTRTVSRRVGSNCHGQNVVEQKSVTRVRRAIVAQPVRTSLDVAGNILGRCASVVGCGLNTVGVVAADTVGACNASCDACVVRVPRRVVTKSLIVAQPACKSCNAAEPTCAAAEPTCAAPAQPTPPAEAAPSAPASGT